MTRKDSHFPEIQIPKLLTVFLIPLLLFSCGALWQTDAMRAVELARTGMYKDAASALESAVEAGNFDPRVVESLYYSWIRQGEYTKARDKFDAWSAAHANAGPLRLAAGRINHLMGNFDRALAHLGPILNQANVGVAAQYERATILEGTGKRQESDAAYAKLIQDYQNGIIRFPDDLLFVAKALAATEYFHDANDILKIVTANSPRNAEAFVTWGDLLAEKYNETEAIASYQDALKIDPNMPEAHLGYARTTELTDPEKSSMELERTMTINPNFIDAHLFVAGQDIGSTLYDKAQEEIDKVLAVNPQSIDALSLLAAIDFLRNDQEGFNKYVAKVIAINPNDSELYATLADTSVSQRLYKQAVVFAREAIRLNPRNWNAMSLLGVNLLRLGEEDEGKATLK